MKKENSIKVNKMSRANILGAILPRASRNCPGSKFEQHLKDAAKRLEKGSRRF